MTVGVVDIALGGNIEVAWMVGVVGNVLGGNAEIAWTVGVVGIALGGRLWGLSALPLVTT